MESWDIFNETILSGKKYFYSNLDIESLSILEDKHANKDCDTFNLKD